MLSMYFIYFKWMGGGAMNQVQIFWNVGWFVADLCDFHNEHVLNMFKNTWNKWDNKIPKISWEYSKIINPDAMDFGDYVLVHLDV